MVQGRSTEIISIVKWIRTIKLSIKNSSSLPQVRAVAVVFLDLVNLTMNENANASIYHQTRLSINLTGGKLEADNDPFSIFGIVIF